MKLNRRSLRAIVLVSGLALSGIAMAENGPTSKPASKPAAKKPSGQPESLKKAITDLQKEATDAMAKGDAVFPRTSSDYFKTLPDDLTVDDVLGAIEKGMSGNAPQVAYVKWQLCSGLPSKVDGPQISRVMGAYRNAPVPLQNFSTDQKTRQQLDRMLMGLKEGQEDQINTQVAKQREQIAAANDPILRYRDALYSRLPITGDSIVARIYDGVTRAQAGVDPKGVLSGLTGDVRGWTAVDATPQQANAVLMVLKDLGKSKGVDVYKAIVFQDEKKGPKWEKDSMVVNAKSTKAIEDILKEYLANPQASTLKFKK
jgi:hypothetical protein